MNRIVKKSYFRRHLRSSGTLAALMLGALLLGSGGVALANANKTSLSYNAVQINITTTTNLNATYQVSTYNSSGSLVATSNTRYPVTSFELPAATYLFTVTALQETSSICYPYASAGASATLGAAIMPPCYWSAPAVEYGYMDKDISGPTNLEISTKPFSSLPTSNITISAKFLNGTEAIGASVSASIVGGSYWWNGGDNHLVMWSQTGKGGVAHLVVPSVPVEVSAWDWLQVKLPQKETTVQTTVGGEKINVTVYWQPSYVGLAASTLVLPPQASASLTLRFQQPNYWAYPYGAKSTGVVPGVSGTAGTIANTAGGVPADQVQQLQAQSGNPAVTQGVVPQIYQTPQISSFSGTTDQSVSNNTILIFAGIAAVAVAVSAVSVFVTIKARK
ncbi:MAG: hypothetical protein OK422_03055 [Thaumarchaeota archaeon]|nr:hypothetical protein [Nitrososphaerota archaeon]